MGLINGNFPISRPEISFFLPTQIIFGTGKVRHLAIDLHMAADLAEHTNVMLITDKGIVAAGLVDSLKHIFEHTDHEFKAIFDDVPPDSDVEVIKRAAQIATDNNINLIMALGGGSVMDTAKATSVVATYGGEPADYEGGFMVPGPIIPIIAIPTTVGTGSEVTLVAMVKDHVNHRKILMSSPFLYPRMAVLDPEMVATLPAKIVAWTGMDALTHSIEAYTCSEHEPFSEALALRSIEMIADNLVAAVAQAGPTEARAKMQLSATMAGMAFTNSPVGAVHAIAHSIGALYGVHHGLANAIALPYVMEFNLEKAIEGYAHVGRALGVGPAGSFREQAEAAIEIVRTLKSQLGIPRLFREVGVPMTDEALDQITNLTLEELCLAFNPRKASPEEIRDLIKQTI